MQDQNANGRRDTVRRAVLYALSVAGLVAAAVIAPRLGLPAGLGVLAMVTLVLVVILLAVLPDDEAGEGAP